MLDNLKFYIPTIIIAGIILYLSAYPGPQIDFDFLGEDKVGHLIAYFTLSVTITWGYFKTNLKLSKKAFSRLKTLSTLRFNYYPKQNKPVEISKQDGVALGCETHVDLSLIHI